MLTSSMQLQNRSFHVVESTRTSSKCQKLTNARAKRAKVLFFIVKYVNLWGFCCGRRHGCLSSLMTWATRKKTPLENKNLCNSDYFKVPLYSPYKSFSKYGGTGLQRSAVEVNLGNEWVRIVSSSCRQTKNRVTSRYCFAGNGTELL